MFGIGTTEVLIILVVALIVIGPKKLPEVAKTLGKALGEFKRMSSDVRRTIDLEADRAEETHRTAQAKKELFTEKKNEPAGHTAEEGVTEDRTPETRAAGDKEPAIETPVRADESPDGKGKPAVGTQDVSGKEA